LVYNKDEYCSIAIDTSISAIEQDIGFRDSFILDMGFLVYIINNINNLRNIGTEE
jgi:hypothetical protein